MVKNNKYKWEQHVLYASESDKLADAEKEWVYLPNSYVPSGEDNCLCSARIKNKFKIVNVSNGKIAFVGITCLKKIVPKKTKISLNRSLYAGPRVEYDNLDIEEYLRHCAAVCGAIDLELARQELARQELARLELARQEVLRLERRERLELERLEPARLDQERLETWERKKLKRKRLERERLERQERARLLDELSNHEVALLLSNRNKTSYETEKIKIDLLFPE